MCGIRRANLVFVSIASAWEIAINTSLGRLSVPMAFEDILDEAGFVLLPVTLDHTDEVAKLPHHHRDPFDRMLWPRRARRGILPWSRTIDCSDSTAFRSYGVDDEPARSLSPGRTARAGLSAVLRPADRLGGRGQLLQLRELSTF